jgi:hypothetical protein
MTIVPECLSRTGWLESSEGKFMLSRCGQILPLETNMIFKNVSQHTDAHAASLKL